MDQMKNLKLVQSLVIISPPDQLWDILTKPEFIKRYLFDVDTFTDWEKGSVLSMKGNRMGTSFENKGKVLEADRGKLLKFTYFNSQEGYDDVPENYSVVTYTLEPLGNGKTKLTYEQEKIPVEIEYQNSAKYLPMILEQIKSLAEQMS
jgi:uncharacterized protein YndB with AHSA1/START domain